MDHLSFSGRRGSNPNERKHLTMRDYGASLALSRFYAFHAPLVTSGYFRLVPVMGHYSGHGYRHSPLQGVFALGLLLVVLDQLPVGSRDEKPPAYFRPTV